MLITGWKKAMRKNGASQRALANELGVNLVELNLVIAGRAFLDKPRFAKACELLQVQPGEMYPAETLELLYGDESGIAKPQRKRDERVRIREPQLSRLDELAKRNNVTRAEAANAILWAHLFPEEWEKVVGKVSDAFRGCYKNGNGY